MAHSPIMALSVAQPWAWMIMHGGKRVENRVWRTSYAGPLVIHASKSRFYLDETEMAELRKIAPALPTADKLDFGAFLGHVNMVGCFNKIDGIAIDARFAKGPWCWALTDPKPFAQPIEGRGQLYLFEPPVEVLRAAGLHWDFQEQMDKLVAGEDRRFEQMKGIAASAPAATRDDGAISIGPDGRKDYRRYHPGDRVRIRPRTYLESYGLKGVLGTIRAVCTFANNFYQRCTVAWDNGRVMDTVINDTLLPAVAEGSAV